MLNRYEVLEKGEGIAILAVGSFLTLGEEVAAQLEKKTGRKATLINPRYLTGIDTALLNSLKKDHRQVITLEDGILSGGFGEKIASFYGSSEMKVYNYGFAKKFLDRYDVDEVLKENHLTAAQIVEDVLQK